MEQRLQWWAYILMAIGIFLAFLALNYVVKIVNDKRFEERMNRLYGKISTCTQVEVPLREIGTKSASKGISLVFTKEDNKHRFIAPVSLDRITEEAKSIKNSNQLLGTIYNNQIFSSHGSFGRIQSEMALPDDHAKAIVFRTSLNRNARMASSADSVGSTQGYKIKESIAVENLKAQNVMPFDYIIHAKNASASSLLQLPEHLFKEPSSDVVESKSGVASSYTENLIQESVSRITSEAQIDPDDSRTINADQSDVAAFMESDKTLQPDLESNFSSTFSSDNIEVHYLGKIYNDNNPLPNDSTTAIISKSNGTKFDITTSKASVKNIANDYPCSSKEIETTSFSSNNTFCKNIVQGMLNKLDKNDEETDEDP